MRRNTIILSIIAIVCLMISGCQQKTSSYLNLDDAAWESWFEQMVKEHQTQNTNPDITAEYACCKAPETPWIVHSNQANLYCTDLELANSNGE